MEVLVPVTGFLALLVLLDGIRLAFDRWEYHRAVRRRLRDIARHP